MLCYTKIQDRGDFMIPFLGIPFLLVGLLLPVGVYLLYRRIESVPKERLIGKDVQYVSWLMVLILIGVLMNSIWVFELYEGLWLWFVTFSSIASYAVTITFMRSIVDELDDLTYRDLTFVFRDLEMVRSLYYVETEKTNVTAKIRQSDRRMLNDIKKEFDEYVRLSDVLDDFPESHREFMDTKRFLEEEKNELLVSLMSSRMYVIHFYGLDIWYDGEYFGHLSKEEQRSLSKVEKYYT